MTDRIKDIPANPNPLENGQFDPTPEKGKKGSIWRTIVSTLKGVFTTSVILLMVGCGINRPPVVTPPPTQPPPVVTPAPPTTVAVDMAACVTPFVDNYCSGVTATIAIEIGPNVWKTYKTDANGYVFIPDAPNVPDSQITIKADGYVTLQQHLDIAHNPLIATDLVYVNQVLGLHNHRDLTPAVKPLPAIPLRQSVLAVHITGQGLMVTTQQYGVLPWWEAALTYLTPADRATIYAAKHASTAWPAGDTHAIIAVPSGRALYDEPNQPYSADRFPALDWTNGGTLMDPAFNNLVKETIDNGFTPMIFLDETMDTSFKTLPVVINALQHSPYGDLTPYVLILPGWDGVFYGWEPSHTVIPQWAANARAICPFCYLGIEHNVGHIPVGEGPSDWTPVGLMRDYDILFSEFWDGVFDDTVWQIAGRTIHPYIRPADQPAGDDPNPPYYMQGSKLFPNEKQPACAFEFAMYGFVHGYGTGSSNPTSIAQWRQYFKNLGYTCGG